MGKQIRLYIADDHCLYRKGIITTLDKDNEYQIAEAGNGKELIGLVKARVPDVVLLDLKMPVMDGRDACIYLERRFPSVKIIILSVDDDVTIVRNLLNIGAHAYLNKAVKGEELKMAISSVIEKDFYLNTLARKAYRSREDFNQPCDTHILSLRELEVVKLIADECTMEKIADKLCISEKTVQNHRTSLMKKLGAKNTAGLIKKAFVRGVLIP